MACVGMPKGESKTANHYYSPNSELLQTLIQFFHITLQNVASKTKFIPKSFSNLTTFLCTLDAFLWDGYSCINLMARRGLLHVSLFSVLALDYEDDIIFASSNATMTRGDKLCFNVTIVDNDEFEFNQRFSFYVSLSSGTSHEYYSHSTTLTVVDNEGELYNS